jgi:hypothetical protein
MMQINYFFDFETEFGDESIRCIPMVVRLKLDNTGIKMSLAAWSRCTIEQRMTLIEKPCNTASEKIQYTKLLHQLILKITGSAPELISIEKNQSWENHNQVPGLLKNHAASYGVTITTDQWQQLFVLQRFALVKLCRPGHENHNFPFALVEFGLCVALPKKITL